VDEIVHLRTKLSEVEGFIDGAEQENNTLKQKLANVED
jgi:hypothetical protein